MKKFATAATAFVLWLGSSSCMAATPAASRPIYLHVTTIYEGRLLIKLLNARADTYLGSAAYRSGAYAHSAGGIDVISPFDVQAVSQGAVRARSSSPSFYRQKSGLKSRVLDYRSKAATLGVDPVAQFLRLSLGSSTPCLGASTVFDGKQRYRLSFVRPRPGRLPAHLIGKGLVTPQTCSLGFTPLSGLGANRAGSGGALRGETTATFGWSPKARLWILTDVEVGTLLGAAHISLEEFSLSTAGGLPS